ncbi:MAG: hypothetical protein HYV63_26990 [Candidatus Schekmanbacteria bacterium]|nr:hypothetical protein [Candidatus Schekmanbacteria bacterium]
MTHLARAFLIIDLSAAVAAAGFGCALRPPGALPRNAMAAAQEQAELIALAASRAEARDLLSRGALSEARGVLDDALALHAGDPELLALRELLAMRVAEAAYAWQLAAVDAAPRESPAARLREARRMIALLPSLRRADLAELLVELTMLEARAAEAGTAASAERWADVAGHWSERAMLRVVTRGWLEPMSPLALGPEEPLERGSMLLSMVRVLDAAGRDARLASILSALAAPDAAVSDAAASVAPAAATGDAAVAAETQRPVLGYYPAEIARALGSGLADLRPDGTVGLTDLVSGAEAADVFDRLCREVARGR